MPHKKRAPIGIWVKKEREKKQTFNSPLSMAKLLITLWMVYQ
jgi:hypothetical protein